MTDLSSLIARLEQAESGSRELDAEIALVSGWRQVSCDDIDDRWTDAPEDAICVALHYCPPSYTTSVDAALTLIPDGWRITHAYGPPWTWCLTNGKERMFTEGKSATAALALTTASIKARMAGE